MSNKRAHKTNLKKKVYLGVRIEQDQFDRVTELMDLTGYRLSELVRMSLDRALPVLFEELKTELET